MNKREAAYKHFMQEEMRIVKLYQDIFNAGYQAALASQAQQEPALKIVNGEICYQSTDDDQCYGMWCPVVYDTVHNFAEGTKFIAIPPAPEGGDK